MDLTHEEHIQVMHLFQYDIVAANIYLAIDDVDLNTDFICAEIDWVGIIFSDNISVLFQNPSNNFYLLPIYS